MKLTGELIRRIWLEEDCEVLARIPAPKTRVLDVGCGQGRYLTRLHDDGHDVVGVDANDSQVGRLRSLGYNAVGVGAVADLPANFDVVIMSHIIEHIPPSDIITFIDTYLAKLRVGGLLIVATPLLYDGFYDDYDHVRPYPPKSISILYSDHPQQQAKPSFRLNPGDIWFRRWPYLWAPANWNSRISVRFCAAKNLLSLVLFYSTFRLVSRRTGWVAAFVKAG